MSQHDDLLVRIESLEKQNRRMRRIGGGLVAALGLVGLMSFAGPPVCKTVWAERFVLKDSSMRERMVLDGYSTSTPSLTLKNTDGQGIASLSINDKGDMSIKLFKDGKPTKGGFQIGHDGKLGFKPANEGVN